jgi:hypothetical protein
MANNHFWKPTRVLGVAFAILLSSYLAACSNQQSDSDKGKVRQVRAKGGREAGTSQGKPVETDQLAPKVTIKSVQNLVAALNVSHQIFGQFWVRYFQEKQDVGSGFQALNLRLQRHFDSKGEARDLYEGTCPKQKTKLQLEWGDEQKKSLKSLVLGVANDCSPSSTFEAAAKVVFESPEVIHIQMLRNFFADGFGLSLSTLGKSMSCTLVLDKEGRLQGIRQCQGLGQNFRTDTYVELSNFEYDKRARHLLNVQGSKFDQGFQKTCEEPQDKPCIDFTATLDGKIKIQENVITPEARKSYEEEKRKRELTPAPTFVAPAQAHTAGPTPAKTNGETSDENPQDQRRQMNTPPVQRTEGDGVPARGAVSGEQVDQHSGDGDGVGEGEDPKAPQHAPRGPGYEPEFVEMQGFAQ